MATPHPASRDTAGGNQALQDNVSRDAPRIMAAYGIIGAILVLGAAGYVVDRWLASAPWGLIIGLALGIVVGFYDLLSSQRRRAGS